MYHNMQVIFRKHFNTINIKNKYNFLILIKKDNSLFPNNNFLINSIKEFQINLNHFKTITSK